MDRKNIPPGFKDVLDFKFVDAPFRRKGDRDMHQLE